MKRLLSWFERKKVDAGEINPDVPQVLVSNFSPLNRLEQLLIDAGYDPKARPAFEHCFLEHDLFLAIRDDGYDDGPMDANGHEFGVYMLEAEDGNSYPAGFSAPERGYDCFGPETVMAKMSGFELLDLVGGSGLWLNPASSFGVLWSAQDVDRVLNR
jgi:hypothetical protein